MTAGLIDSYGRSHNYLRISLTDRCNLRCAYCMPDEHVDWTPAESLLRSEEILRLSRLFVGLGINKIRLTGGEPLLRRDLPAIIADLAAISGLRALAMTTNGIGLDKCVQDLRRYGLGGLTISLDTLRRDRFTSIAKRDRFNDVIKGIEAALAAGFAPLKINIVVMRNVNDDEVVEFVDWGASLPLHLRFIEYMPFPENHWSHDSVVSYAEIRARIEEKYQLISLGGDRSSVGKDFQVAGCTATVGFVTSMTESFCSGCTRLRLTADGQIKPCLFHRAEINLRDIIREGGRDDAVREAILLAVKNKPEAHPPMEELLTMPNRAMIAIGG